MHNLDREQLRDLFWAGVGALLIIMVAALWAHAASAEAAAPCPPRIYTCSQARSAFERFGEGAVVDRARACGWSEAEIARALKCARR